jgi:hypothetical protein
MTPVSLRNSGGIAVQYFVSLWGLLFVYQARATHQKSRNIVKGVGYSEIINMPSHSDIVVASELWKPREDAHTSEIRGATPAGNLLALPEAGEPRLVSEVFFSVRPRSAAAARLAHSGIGGETEWSLCLQHIVKPTNPTQSFPVEHQVDIRMLGRTPVGTHERRTSTQVRETESDIVVNMLFCTLAAPACDSLTSVDYNQVKDKGQLFFRTGLFTFDAVLDRREVEVLRGHVEVRCRAFVPCDTGLLEKSLDADTDEILRCMHDAVVHVKWEPWSGEAPFAAETATERCATASPISSWTSQQCEELFTLFAVMRKLFYCSSVPVPWLLQVSNPLTTPSFRIIFCPKMLRLCEIIGQDQIDHAFHRIDEDFCGQHVVGRLKEEFIQPLVVQRQSNGVRSPMQPRGILLWGPSGTGKSTLARMCTNDCGFRVLWHGSAIELNRPLMGQVGYLLVNLACLWPLFGAIWINDHPWICVLAVPV